MSKIKSKKATSSSQNIPKQPEEVQGNITKSERLIPLTEWPKHHPWPPLGGLRHIRFFAEQKGVAHCFVKSGGRVKIREHQFLEWSNTDQPD